MNKLWNYELSPAGKPQICRLAPSAQAVHLEWLGGEPPYRVFFRKRDEGEFCLAGQTESTFFDIPVPEGDTDYELYVQSQGESGAVRLVRAGESVGTVVNYLHPEDRIYGFSGSRLASPSLLRLPDGTLLASMDVYEKNGGQNLTLVFASTDDGASWHYRSALYPCFWGKLFLHRDELYMLACSTEYGDLLIGRSPDGGRTFGAPTVIARGKEAGDGVNGFHRAPQNVICYNDRLYTSYEWGAWANRDFCHAAGVLSCDAAADLLNADSWKRTEPLKFDPAWVQDAGKVTPVTATIEGTVVIDPKGNLLDVLRFECPAAKVILYRANEGDPTAPLAFERTMDFPAGHSKFTILERDGRYYSVATRYFEDGMRTARGRAPRNLLSLLVSDDLVSWRVAEDLIDCRDRDMNKHGFQYVDFMFDGEEILYLCRTALNGAADFHDTNYITFHRIENYREL